ncbi:MAG: alpha/beta fold hydrolase, partial [Bdellovibrio sp.]
LSYRLYPARSEDLVVLYPGMGGVSRYMCVLASAIASAGYATVVTPDLRGHGVSLGLSDKISPDQLEIDLEEMLIHLKMKRAISRVTLSGHSLGGGFILRVASSAVAHRFSRFIALAPYLPRSWGVLREGLGGWVSREEGGFRVNMPESQRSGQEKLFYSAEYLQAVSVPEDFLQRLQSNQVRGSVLVGAEDEVAIAEAYPTVFDTSPLTTKIVEGLNHLSLVTQPQSYLDYFVS